MRSISLFVLGVGILAMPADAGILVGGDLFIKGGPVIDGVRYPSDTIVSLDVRNDTDQAIAIPTFNLTVTSEDRDGITVVTISIPESLSAEGQRVPVSRPSLGIVVAPPGKESYLAVRTSTAINHQAPTRVILRIDAESSQRYGLTAGDHEVTLPPLLSQERLAQLKQASEQSRKAKQEKTAEPGATDNPDDAQRLREDH